MKKLLCALLILVLSLPLAASADVDLSGMSFDELVALREQINLAIWNCQEWQEVTVPIGIWKIGEDIPVGKWTIRIADDATASWAYFNYGNQLDETGTGLSVSGSVWHSFNLNSKDSKDNDSPVSVDIDCQKDMYIVIERAPLVFSPFTGKPDLGFH